MKYKEILLLNSSEKELLQCKRMMDMFGIAEHIHTETSGTSAMYYLRNVAQLPELVIASFGKRKKDLEFIAAFQDLLLSTNKKSTIVLLYDEDQKEFKLFRQYRQLKKPLCVPELCDTREWWEQALN